MLHNRISGYYEGREAAEETAAPIAPAGFAVVSLSQLPPDAQLAIQRQQSLYQLAFAQAQAERAD
jgi:hypothetical protein